MSLLAQLFSFVCNQNAARSFVIAGRTLPFCQRCTGVYLGLGLITLYLLASRLYRRGFAPGSLFYVQVAGLLAMPVFGFHLLDPGPAWRLWSGLIFGGGLAYLIVPATAILWAGGRVAGPYDRRSTIAAWVLWSALNMLALWFPIQSRYLYDVVLAVSFLGLLSVAFCLATAMALLLKRILITQLLKGLGHVWTKS